MLRLVHPAREGQDPPRPSKGGRPAALSLTAEEGRHVVRLEPWALQSMMNTCGLSGAAIQLL